MDAGGDAVAVWTHNDGSSLSVQAAEYGIAGNTSSAPGTVGTPARPPAAGKLTPAPWVHLLYTPNRPHKPHPAGGPRWTFHFSDQNPEASFDCRLDGSRFRSCAPPMVYRHLSRGRHVFRVKSHGPDGKISATRIVHFYAGRQR